MPDSEQMGNPPRRAGAFTPAGQALAEPRGISSAPHPHPQHSAPSLPGECGLGGEDKAEKLCHSSWNLLQLKEEQSQGVTSWFLAKLCFVPVVWKCQAKITVQSSVLTGEKKNMVFAVLFSLRGCGGDRQRAQHFRKAQLKAEHLQK